MYVPATATDKAMCVLDCDAQVNGAVIVDSRNYGVHMEGLIEIGTNVCCSPVRMTYLCELHLPKLRPQGRE